MPQLGLLETLVQGTPYARAKRDAVAAHQSVVNDLVLERQQNCLRHDRQIRTNQVLEWLRQRQDPVIDRRVGGREEDRVLLQFTEDIEPTRHKMPPGTNDVEFVV